MGAVDLLTVVGPALANAAAKGGKASKFADTAAKIAATANDPKSPGGAAIASLKKNKSARAAATTAGGVGGTVACAAFPYTAPAAPLCGLVAGVTAGLIYDGVFAINKSINKRRNKIRKKLKDAVANQNSLDLALEETLSDLVKAWRTMAPKEKPITKDQAGDLLAAVGLPIVWDIPMGTDALCKSGQQKKAAWRVPFYQSLMYDHPSLVRHDRKCNYGDTSPTRKEIRRREATADAAMALFESKFADAVEKAGSVLITFASERTAMRLLLDETERKREAIVVKNKRNVRIRNYVIVSSAVLGAAGLTWIILRRRTLR
jgi:hypothetical protein